MKNTEEDVEKHLEELEEFVHLNEEEKLVLTREYKRNGRQAG